MSFLHRLSCILEDLTGKLILMRSLGGFGGGVRKWLFGWRRPSCTFISSLALYKLTPKEFTSGQTWIPGPA